MSEPMPPCARCWHNARQHGANWYREPELGELCYAAIEGWHGTFERCQCRGYRRPRKVLTVRATNERL